jgi:hypothetical protein
LLILLFAKYNQNDLVKEDEIGSAYSMHQGEEECIQGFGGKARRKETTMKTNTQVQSWTLLLIHALKSATAHDVL